MRILIAEDEALMRHGLLLVLEDAGHDVVGVAADALELMDLVDDRNPDLVITDIRMPPTNTDDGLRAAVTVRSRHPDVAVLVLSHFVEREYAMELVSAGTSGVGYLLKQRVAHVEQFQSDVERVASGGTVLDPDVVEKMVARASREDRAFERLTPRQREVLALIAEGRSNSAIARQLSISDKAVVQHTSRIYDHLGLPVTDDDHRRVLAVLRYLAG